MTTVGDVDDFRHFLPRIFELLVDGALTGEIDPEIVLGKLTYGGWFNWPEPEQAAIRAYLGILWQRGRCTAEAQSWLCAIARAEPDVLPYLDAWAHDPSPAAQAALAAFLEDPGSKLEGFWEDAAEQWRQVIDWKAARR